MQQRILSSLLLLSLLCTLLAGCSGDRTPQDSRTAASCVTSAISTDITASVSTTAPITTVHTTVRTTAATTQTTTASAEPVQTTEPAQTTASWTVFEYLCGTDLESEYGAATANLEELVSVSLQDADCHYLIETGGAKTWRCGVNPDRLQRWSLENGQLVLADELEPASMGDGETLSDFLRWGAENYPAEHYMLILWDHGGGAVSGVVFDELYDNDSLSMTELSDALTDADITLDIIGFDACLMANLETAAAVAPYADYMIASEETIPAGGWDYRAFPAYLAENPACTPEELSVYICDSYLEKCTQSDTAAMATLSVLDLKQLPTLLTCFDALAGEMDSLTADITSLVTFSQGTKRAESYGGEGMNLVDLGALITESQEILPHTAASTLDALTDTVLYRVAGENRAYGNGLSVFYPLNADADLCDAYREVCTSDNYLRYISAVVSDWDAPADLSAGDVSPVAPEDYHVETETWISGSKTYSMRILSGGESVSRVLFNLYYLDRDTDSRIILGTDDDLNAEWESYLFDTNLRGVWPAINGCFCAPTLLEQEEEYNLYAIPVLLNGEETSLRVTYVWAEQAYHILGVYEEADADTGMAGRDIRQLKAGDVVEPLFECVNMTTGRADRCTLAGTTITEEPVFEEIRLTDGDYLYQFELRDVFGSSYRSDLLPFEIANGHPVIG